MAASRPRVPELQRLNRLRRARTSRPWAPILTGLLAIVTISASARATEPTTGERAIAESLYDRGRRQMDDGQVTTACETFAESQRLDPGTGTLLNLASCHEAAGKLASAWVEFREAIATLRHEKRTDRLRYALDHLAAVEPRLAYVTISVPEAAQGHAPVVTLDGRILGPAAWGVAIPVDAGWHEALAQSDAGGPWRATIKIRDGQRRRLDVPSRIELAGTTIVDEDDGVPVTTTARAAASLEPPPSPELREGSTKSRAPSNRRRVAGLVVAGAGVLALGFGAYAGWRAHDLWGQRNLECPMDACTAEGVRLGSRAVSTSTVATWTIVGGVVALGAAALLLLWPASPAPVGGTTARADATPRMRVGGALGANGAAHLTLEGTF